MRRFVFSISCFALSAASALATELTLRAEEIAALPEEARESYEQAASDFDVAYSEGGLRNLARAAELAPDAMSLQLLTARVAEEESEARRGMVALEALETARLAYERVLESESATEYQRGRAERGLAALEGRMTEINERERRLREGGDAFIRQYSALEQRIEASRVARPRRNRSGNFNENRTGSNPLLPNGRDSRRNSVSDQQGSSNPYLQDGQIQRRRSEQIVN